MLASFGLNAWNFLMSSVYYVSTQNSRFGTVNTTVTPVIYLFFKALYYGSGTLHSPANPRLLIFHDNPENMHR